VASAVAILTPLCLRRREAIDRCSFPAADRPGMYGRSGMHREFEAKRQKGRAWHLNNFSFSSFILISFKSGIALVSDLTARGWWGALVLVGVTNRD
jgi:hypothetical protein